MLTVIIFLILFFILLITFQIILAYSKSSVIEGMMDVVPTISPTFTPTSSPSNEMLPNLTINQVYRQYDKKIADNTFLMSQQNAGNIEYLKGRIDDVQGMYKQVQDLSGSVQALQEQVNGLVTAQQDYATQMTGGVPPDITGATTSEDSEPVDTSSFVT